MNKNIKSIFFITLTLLLIVGISSVTAADNSTTTDVISDSATTTTPEIQTTPNYNDNNDNVITEETKEIQKENKNLKTATKTVEVNNIDELTSTINSAVNDAENDEYIINLNPGTYKNTAIITMPTGSYQPNIIINCNNQTLEGTKSLRFDNGCNITINNVNIKQTLQNFNNNIILNNVILGKTFTNRENTELNIINSTLNAQITNSGILVIDDLSTATNTFKITNPGKIYTNNTNITDSLLAQNIYLNNTSYTNTTISVIFYNYADMTIENSNITKNYYNYGNMTITNGTITKNSIENYGNLTINNLSLNSTIRNYGNLIISDDTIIESGCSVDNLNDGFITINDTSRITPHISTYSGLFTVENININSTKTNNGNLTIINCNFTGYIYNYGNIIVKNSTMNGTITSYSGSLIFDDEVIFGNRFILGGNYDNIEINDTTRISPYLNKYDGNYIIENTTITSGKTNNGNLTIRNTSIDNKLTNSGNLIIESNSTLNSYLPNGGTMTVRNSTLNAQISNQGTLIIEDNVILGSGFSIIGSGKVITDDFKVLFPYMYNFTGEAVLELGDYNNNIYNLGNLTIENSTLNCQIIENKANEHLIFNNSTITDSITRFYNYETLEFYNSTINTKIYNYGILIISDDTILGESFSLVGSGEVIINDTNKIAEFLQTYYGNTILNNKTINEVKTNYENLTLTDCIINSTINNNGIIYIDDNTNFTENAKIRGYGQIVTSNITRLLPYIDTINGNYTITDVTLNKSYLFIGNNTLNNCIINSDNNTNFGVLNINNCTVNSENTFLNNYVTIILDESSTLDEKINNNGEIFKGNPTEEWTYNPKYHIVNNDTVTYFFERGGLTSLVNLGDTLDFQGTISNVNGFTDFIINKPINIITSTNDGRIENFSTITYLSSASGSNVTGLYTYNTQFYVRGAHDIVFDNISNVVDNKQVGWGVGQSSIRENSSNITVKNSYFYTNNNGGSSTLVLAWADNCTILNNTIIGGEYVGNLLYLTTYNVDIPNGVIPNCNNKLINNTITTEYGDAICIGVVFCGVNNTIDGNKINTGGAAISYQWGSGVDGAIQEVSLFESTNNIISNNNVTQGGVSGGDIVYNNYIGGTISIDKGQAYNNTINRINVGKDSTITNNNINTLSFSNNAQNSTIENNNIVDINIATTANNIRITNNNITRQININGSDNNITNNNITNNANYTITGKGTGNIITDNYLVTATTFGDASVKLNPETNTIENNMPYENKLKVDTTEFTAGQSATITASIYYGSEVNSTISKGKVTFKVNGKTLKDASGKVIYAKVVNGVATIENYEVPSNWTKEGTIIEAVYSGSTQCGKLTSEKTNITVATPEATLTLTPITSDVQTGSTVTLKAKVAVGDKAITTGKIVFKVNGKTVKDENGKVIYAKVDSNGEVSVDYTLPESFKAGTYNIEAVFTASGYEKLTDNTTMTVVKS